MRNSEMNDKTQVERLRSFLEIEDDEITQMSLDDVREELLLLGINPSEFSASLQARVSNVLSDSKLVKSEIPSGVKKSARASSSQGSWFQRIAYVVSIFFQFFSKTDRIVLAQCSENTQKSQTAIGAMVFVSGLLAIISGAYAIHITFPSTIFSIVAGFMYGTIILLLDRELVSFPRKTAVLPRLIFAVFVGFVISVPLELKVFDSRINEEIARSRFNEEKSILDRQSQANSAYDAKINILERDIREYREGITRALVTMEAEAVGRQIPGRTGRAGVGPVYHDAERLKDNYERLLAQAETQLKDVQETRAQEFDAARKEATLMQQSISYDLLSRHEALGKIQASSRDALYIIWGVRLLFVLFQVLPIMLYLLMSENEYVAILEANRRKAIARVHAIANAHIAMINEDPNVSLPRTYLPFGSVKNNVDNSMGGQTMTA